MYFVLNWQEKMWNNLDASSKKGRKGETLSEEKK